MIAFNNSDKFNLAWCWKTNTALVLVNDQAIHYPCDYSRFFLNLVRLSINNDLTQLNMGRGTKITSYKTKCEQQVMTMYNEVFQFKTAVTNWICIEFMGKNVQIPILDVDLFFHHPNIFAEELILTSSLKYSNR